VWHTSTDKTTCSTLSTQRGGFNPIRPGPTEGTDPIMAKILDCIASLLDANVPVFPCKLDKSPACPHGFRDASTDPNIVSHLFGLVGTVLIGVPTGSASGLDVLDLDPRHGGHLWWRREAHRLPLTRQHKTRSGGLHLLFRAHPDVRCSQGLIAPGVDVRATGGYVIWWPAFGYPVDNPTVLAAWPPWLLSAMRPRPQPVPASRTRHPDRMDQPAPGAAQRIAMTTLARLEGAADGQRHLELRKAGFTLGGLLQHLEMTRAEAVAELVGAAMRAGGEDQANATRTATWAVERGEARPLTMGGRP